MSNFRVNLADINGQQQTPVDIAAVLGIVEYVEHPFAKGNLTTDGVQYSAEVGVATATTDLAVESITIEPLAPGDVKEYELGLTAAFKATSSTTADIIYQWQGRNKDGTWVNLHAAASLNNLGTAYAGTTEPTQSGRFKATTDFNRVPFDIRLIFQCNEANQGYAKTKNSSYVKAVYSAD